jgi:hypothetical protein
MKTAKFVFFFLSVLLAGILAGCVNSLAPVPEAKEQVKQARAGGPAFTVTLSIGGNGEARSITGGVTGILAAENKYSINISQFIMVNKKSGKIIYCSKKERTADDDPTLSFSVNNIPFGEEYVFMLLMGHKERTNYSATTGYAYADKAPTLLLAGTKTMPINGPTNLTIELWPLVVDTQFVANGNIGDNRLTVEPAAADNKPKVVLVPPTDTKVIWKVIQGTNGINGFINLFAVHKLFPDSNGNFKMVKAGRTIVRGVGINSGNKQEAPISLPTLAAAGAQLADVGTIILDISLYTKGDNGNIRPIDRIGKEGSVNFELDYVPFGPDLWSKAININIPNPIPAWIIRNGINSEPQDAKTIFVGTNEALGWGINGANGNGAIRFKLTNGTGDSPATGGGGANVVPGLNTLAISNGSYTGTNGATLNKAKIGFTVVGSGGLAAVYYVSANTQPDFSSYKFLSSYNDGSHTVEIDKPADDQTIYMLIYRHGKIAYSKIETSGGATVNVTYNPGN